MLAAIFKGDGKLVLEERPIPEIKKSTDVLIKVKGVGICGTDLHILQVPPAHPSRKDIILGHEFTGQVAAVGTEVKEFKVGENVLIDPHPGCGQCSMCRRGYPDQCITLIAASGEPGHPATIGIFSDGAMAEYALVPSYFLYKINQKVPSHIAALAEPFACVVSASKKLNVQPGDSVLILGAGPIGLLFTSLLKKAGASKLIVSEPSEYRRAAAADCGATRVVDPNNEDLDKIIKEETDGLGADIVVEAVGHMIITAIEFVRFGGKVLQFGHDEIARPQVPVGEIVKKELTIHGAFIGKYTYNTVAKIMESGDLPLERIVSHRLPLNKIHEGIELLKKQQGIKIIIEPES